MKIGIAGKESKKKQKLAKEIAAIFGLRVAPLPRLADSADKWGATLEDLELDQERLFNCAAITIVAHQGHHLKTPDFVTGHVYTDIYEDYLDRCDITQLMSGDERVRAMGLMCFSDLSFFDIVFVMPGTEINKPVECGEHIIKLVYLKGDSVDDLAKHAKKVLGLT